MPDLKPYTPPPPIREAWRPLAWHADGCDVCLPHIQRLVAFVDPRRTDFEVYEELCEEGKELFTPWRLAKDDWLAETLPRRQRQFITDDELAADGVSFELRGEAIMSMPAKVFQAWLALPDDRRHAQLLALEAGQRTRPGPPFQIPSRRTGQGSRGGDPNGQRRMTACEGCGTMHSSGGRFHSRECRLKYEEEQGC